MFRIPIKPLSQNLPNKYQSPVYRQYQQDIITYLATLPLPNIDQKQPFYFYFQFGVSSNQDLTNGIKILEDIICDYLGINDRDLYGLFCRKISVDKQDHYILFNIFTDEYSLIEAINKE